MDTEITKLMQQRKWDEARFRLESMLQVTPTNAKLHAYIGSTYFGEGDYRMAAESFRKAVTLDPDFYEAGVKLAQALDYSQQYEEALEVAKTYLAKKSSDNRLISLIRGVEKFLASQPGATSGC